ncbi:MAG: glycosyltransferase family 4 protein [Gammaproteobacteria bacterium]|nr:glycosyltransferase family 4 protein [Gammaproteobacteria bacterium]
MKKTQAILAIFIEPTPYILDFLNALERQWPGKIDVFFLKENHTQAWVLDLPEAYRILSTPLIQSIVYLNRRIVREKYKLIHLAGWGNLTCLSLMLLGRFKGIPLSIESDTQLNKTIPKWKQLIKYWGYQRPLYPILFKLPSVFLPGGTRQQKYLEHYGVAKKKIVLAQMTVDITALQEKILSITQEEKLNFRHTYHAHADEVIFLYVGRLLALKGIIELIEAFKAMSNSRAKLWIVGTGVLEAKVVEMIRDFPNIHYFGREQGNRLIEIYHAADVLVLPSRGDAWGLVVNEAMAAENAIIISEDAGCVDDLVFHEETGLLVPPKDIDALVLAMKYLTADDGVRKKIATQAKQHIAPWTLENEASNVVHAWSREVVDSL